MLWVTHRWATDNCRRAPTIETWESLCSPVYRFSPGAVTVPRGRVPARIAYRCPGRLLSHAKSRTGIQAPVWGGSWKVRCRGNSRCQTLATRRAEQAPLRARQRQREGYVRAFTGVNACFWWQFIQRHFSCGFDVCDHLLFENNHCD